MSTEYKWTDESVKEFVTDLLRNGFYDIPKHLQDFKESKQPKPLFITEDRVGINKDYPNGISAVYNDFSVNYDWPANDIISQLNDHQNVKYFSTREAADEYIVNNKPCLSLSDVVKTWNECATSSRFQGDLKDFVLNKLTCQKIKNTTRE